jgi:tetratricopeptide (TPR) repeat protein
VAFDREGTLRKAEKLLRQGKLDLAIAEYHSVVEDQPTDWNTANALGDLYFRAGQVDKAVGHYARIADNLASEGFTPKAVALYRKILKIKPDEERAMWHLGQISARQGLLVEARSQFLALAERRRSRGDRRGEAEVRVLLGDLPGSDLETRLTGARARVELGHAAPALAQLKQIAVDLQEKGQQDQALSVLQEAATLAPDDVGLRRSLMAAAVARGDFETARQFAGSAGEIKELAEELFRQGRDDEGLVVLASAAEADPSDTAIRAWLVKTYVARGDKTRARELLTPELAASDSELLLMLAEMELRDGRIPEGTALLERIIGEDPGRRDALVILGCSVAEVNPDAGYQCVDVAARAAIAADEWGSAAAALNEFVNRVPNHIPALMRLVEICVDGGLEATMYTAQAQLADAYLETGSGLEARVIAEDLVAREPWDRSNIERFRRALTLLGEVDADAIIADRLSGQSPFLSTDLSWDGELDAAPRMPADPEPVTASEPGPAVRAAPPGPNPAEPPPKAARSTRQEEGEPVRDKAPVPPRGAKVPNASVHAIDLSGFFDEVTRDEVRHDDGVTHDGVTHDGDAHVVTYDGDPHVDTHEGDSHLDNEVARQASHEVDLSEALYDMKKARDGKPPSLESVLKGVRAEAVHEASSPEVAEQHFKLATSYIEMGMIDEAISALEVSAQSLRHRFRSGALLGKLYMDKGDKTHAVEWLERAVEAPAPTPAAAHQLLYDLASALEAHGEGSRALAVFLELQAEAGDYRDLAARLEHLTKAQAGS